MACRRNYSSSGERARFRGLQNSRNSCLAHSALQGNRRAFEVFRILEIAVSEQKPKLEYFRSCLAAHDPTPPSLVNSSLWQALFLLNVFVSTYTSACAPLRKPYPDTLHYQGICYLCIAGARHIARRQPTACVSHTRAPAQHAYCTDAHTRTRAHSLSSPGCLLPGGPPSRGA